MSQINYVLLQEQLASVQKKQDDFVDQLENYMEQIGIQQAAKGRFQLLQLNKGKQLNSATIEQQIAILQNVMGRIPEYILKVEKTKKKAKQIQERIQILKSKLL